MTAQQWSVVACLAIALLCGSASALTRQASSTPRHVQVLVWGNTSHPLLQGGVECDEQCHITTNSLHLATSDVVVFELGVGQGLVDLPPKPHASQEYFAWLNGPASRLSEFQDASYLERFDGEVSYRQSADVWLSPLPNPPVSLLGVPPAHSLAPSSPLVVFAEDTCKTHSKREDFVRELMRHMQVDSVGKCLNNKPLNTTQADITAVLAAYPFTLVLETDLETDFVGSRLYQALRAGSVPVYAGARNIASLLPVPASECVVLVSDFATPKDLAAHLTKLVANPPDFKALLAWKTRGLSSRFVRAALDAPSAPLCALCDHYRTAHTAHPPSPVSDEDLAHPTLAASHMDDAALGAQGLLQRNSLMGLPATIPPECPTNCSNHGQCVEKQCECHGGWRGVDCSVPIAECPNNCSRHGICIEEVCLCDDGWIGEGCELIDPRLQWQCELYCGERGVCIDGKCRCAEGYCGDDCSLLIGSCVNDCSGHGTCCDSRCVCESGWWGDKACDREGPSCPFDFDCTGHGECMDGKCVCDKGWTDYSCSVSVAVFEPLRREGPATVIAPDPCPRNCSGHGACSRPEGCDCDAGWDGKACDIERSTSCPTDYDCANGGRCVKGRCVDCDVGYSGFDCRTEPNPTVALPPNNAVGERGDVLAVAPSSGAVKDAAGRTEVVGKAVLKTRFDKPPVVLVQAHDDLPQSIAVAAVAVTRRPHAFLYGDEAADVPREHDKRVVVAVAQTLPPHVEEGLREMHRSERSLPEQLHNKPPAAFRPFSFVAMQQGIWRLQDGAMLIAGSRPVCAKLESGSVFEWAKDSLLTIPFPRRWNKRPVVMVGLMSPMLSAPMPGIVGTITVERVTLTDFTVRLPSDLCASITASRSLADPSTLASSSSSSASAASARGPELLQVGEGKSLKPGIWGDDVEEYVNAECVRFPKKPGPPSNPYAYETASDWSGVPASERPCYAPALHFSADDDDDEARALDALVGQQRDPGYGPDRDAIADENAYPKPEPGGVSNGVDAPLRPRAPGLGKLTLGYIAVDEGLDSFEGGVRIRATAIQLPPSSDLIPVDLDVGVSASDAPERDNLQRPINPHPEALLKDLDTLTAPTEVLQQNPLTGAWEYVLVPRDEKDFPSSSLFCNVFDPSHKHAVSVAYRAGRELEMGLSQDVVDSVAAPSPVAAAAAAAAAGRARAASMVLLQAGEAALLSQDEAPAANASSSSSSSSSVQPAAAMGETARVFVEVPAASHGEVAKVRLSRAYDNPVVIAEPLSKSPLLNEPVVALVHGVGGAGGDELSVSLAKPSLYNDQAAASGAVNATKVFETLNVVVMEEGAFVAGESVVQVGKVTTDTANPHTGWIRVDFASPFRTKPVVLTQLQTTSVLATEGDDASSSSSSRPPLFLKTRQAEVDERGFSVAVEAESEGVVDGWSGERIQGLHIGFIAVQVSEEGVDSWDDGALKVHADCTSNVVQDAWFALAFAHKLVSAVPAGSTTNPNANANANANGGAQEGGEGGFAAKDESLAPVFVGHVGSYASDAPCHARIRNLAGDGVDVKVESDDTSSPRSADEGESLCFAVFSRQGVVRASRSSALEDVRANTVAKEGTLAVGGGALVKSFARVPEPALAASAQCPGGAVPCNDHGVCNATSGACECDAFWEGDACETASKTYIGENGRVDIAMAFPRELHVIEFRHTYHDPVVFLSPVTKHGDVPIVARVASVAPHSCTVFLEHPHAWQGGAPLAHDTPETLMFLVLEKGVWEIDAQGNTVEVQTVTTAAAAGIESAAVGFKRARGASATAGRSTSPVVFSQVQTAHNRLLVKSVVARVEDTLAKVALDAERVVQPSDSRPLPFAPPDPATALRGLRLSTDGAHNGTLSGTLFFAPPRDLDTVVRVDFMFAQTPNVSSVVGAPFASLDAAALAQHHDGDGEGEGSVAVDQQQLALDKVAVPSIARFVVAVSRPVRGPPAFVPIIADADNPFHPKPVPLGTDPQRLPLLPETVGVLVMSAGVGSWDSKSFVANTGAAIPTPSLLSWVDFLDPQDKVRPRPLVTFPSAPLTYLAGVDPEGSVLGSVPAHLALDSSFQQSIDRSSAKLRVDVEVKRHRALELPANLTVSYFALVQEGLLSGRDAGCPNDCSGADHGECRLGLCWCAEGFAGEDCAKVVDAAACGAPCDADGAHAVCVDGACECENGYTGAPRCDVAVSDRNAEPDVEELCPRNCSQHGVCDGGVKCQCDAGWDGDDCSQRVCTTHCNERNGGGACVHGKCACVRTFAGDDCTQRVCAPSPTCSNNGECVEGACVCAKGWGGEDCTEQDAPPVCPNMCSGHGRCREDTRECECDQGYRGDDCAALVPCPYGEFLGVKSEEECGGHGWCNRGVCACGEGWVGDACDAVDPNWVSDCPFNCSGRGVCTPSGCVCFPPHGGRGCRQMTEDKVVMGDVLSIVLRVSPKQPVQRVDFPRAYASPVVFAKPPSRSSHPATPLAVQVLGVGADHCNVTSVQAQLAMSSADAASPVPSAVEMVTLVVVEEGSWDLRNGLLLHVGKVPVARVAENGGAFQQGYPRFFSKHPAVLAQAQGVPASGGVVRSRVRASRAKNFVLGVLASGADEETGEVEVGWMAVGESSSSVVASPDASQQFAFDSLPFFHTVKAVSLDAEWHHVAFDDAAKLASPRVVADVAVATAFPLRYHGLGPKGVWLGFENEADGSLVVEANTMAVVSVVAFGAPGALRAFPVQCPDKCGYDGERGKCDRSKCVCEDGWAGLTCKVPAANCPGECTAHGACTSAGCRCRSGWIGADCGTRAAAVKVELIALAGSGDQLGAKPAECEDNCSGHGSCVDSVCVCTDPEWLGWKCHIPNPCVRQCSNHGQCIEGEGCLCDGGWGGPACDEPALQCPFDFDCGDGECVEGKCVCDQDHFGFNCARAISDKALYEERTDEPQLDGWLRRGL